MFLSINDVNFRPVGRSNTSADALDDLTGFILIRVMLRALQARRFRTRQLCVAKLVGRGGLEPPTSRLSGVRSNHLSYRPKTDR